jgi:competence protein ComEA
MPTPAERQALLFFAAVAALGVGVNAWRAAGGGERLIAGSPRDLAAQIARVDSAVASSPSRESGRAALRKRNADRAAKKRATEPATTTVVPSTVYRPPSTVSRLDLDVAPASAIESLPKIGPALAARIVANRDSFGAFGSLEGLQRVKGIGPAFAKALKDRAAFSGVPRPDAPSGKDKGRRRRAVP